MNCYQLYLEMDDGALPIMLVFDGRDDEHAKTIGYTKYREHHGALGYELVRGEHRIIAAGSYATRKASRVRHPSALLTGWRP